MISKFPTKIFCMLLVAATLFSCASKKKILYLQSNDEQKTTDEFLNYEPLLQPDDELMIIISAENPEVVVPYNLSTFSFQTNSDLFVGQQRIQSYLIDKEGYIEMPMLGKLKLAGMTRLQAIEKIKNLLVNDIKNPTVNLRLLNFKVSVLGEVNRPGIQNIQSDRITVLEALSYAGDLTIYGDRKSILIIREIDGVKTIETVDITNRDLINSPYYYLSQNDVVYVEPNKTKVNSSVVGPNVTVILTSLSLVIAVLALTIN